MECPRCAAICNEKYCSYCGSAMPVSTTPQQEAASTHTTYITNNYNTAPPNFDPPRPTQNYSQHTYTPAPYGKKKNKWISFFLCLFTICGHKFYEGKYIMGIVYLCTAGLFGIGYIFDLINLLINKPNTYYV